MNTAFSVTISNISTGTVYCTSDPTAVYNVANNQTVTFSAITTAGEY
ncbi:MAG: hypothetical protein QXV17_10045 [Candidatus Micrarchaeaceae archaeon]